MDSKQHGQLTAKVADILSKHDELKGYEVLSDHSPKKENIGKIASWFGERFSRETELSQLDIAIVEKDSSKAIALIEIEETSDRPKTFLGDVFGVLMGDHVCFEGKRDLLVDEQTTLIIIGKSETQHKERNKYFHDKVLEIKSLLHTGNSKINALLIDTFDKDEELSAKLLLTLETILKEKV